MYLPPTGMRVLAYPGLVNLGLPLFKSRIFALEGNTHNVSGIFLWSGFGLFPKQA